VLRRSFVLVLFGLVLVASACGGGTEHSGQADSTGSQPLAAVVVTSDCGKTVVLKRTPVDSDQTAMRALDRLTDIETDSGGKFVTAINGVEQDTKKKLAWLYYIDGKSAQKGATEIRLEAGDVEWWDLHDYEHECETVPPEVK
jgi:Domain of unknown function (DUF4430)